MKTFCRWIGFLLYVAGVCALIYVIGGEIVYRFSHPELTQTQLIIELFGKDTIVGIIGGIATITGGIMYEVNK